MCFLSRVKDNMAYDWIDEREWDRTDPCQHGVTSLAAKEAQAQLVCITHNLS